ncbi:MAG: Dabb family protein [Gaiellales bacterium]
MLQHTVLFKFPRTLDPAEEKEMRAKIESWPATIDVLRAVRFGAPLSADYAAGYQYLLHLEVDDTAALNTYLNHPAHLEFGAWTTERGAEYVVVPIDLDAARIV